MTEALNLGSRIKTPSLPLWVTRCNGSFGVLFNPNKDLLRSHNAEKRFKLYKCILIESALLYPRWDSNPCFKTFNYAPKRTFGNH